MTQLPKLSEFGYHLEHATRFGDCDMYGHVNNVIYYSYYDTVINTFLIDIGHMSTHGSTVGLCAASDCTYHKSIQFPCKIIFGLRTIHIGNSSVKYQVGIFKPSNSTDSTEPILCALGTFIHVFVNKEIGSVDMKSTKIPNEIRNALQSIYVSS
jgi:acyl-CoA thioester hydrolase